MFPIGLLLGPKRGSYFVTGWATFRAQTGESFSYRLGPNRVILLLPFGLLFGPKQGNSFVAIWAIFGHKIVRFYFTLDYL